MLILYCGSYKKHEAEEIFASGIHNSDITETIEKTLND